MLWTSVTVLNSTLLDTRRKLSRREFPGSPEVRPASIAGGTDSIPGLGTRIPHVKLQQPKREKKYLPKDQRGSENMYKLLQHQILVPPIITHHVTMKKLLNLSDPQLHCLKYEENIIFSQGYYDNLLQ